MTVCDVRAIVESDKSRMTTKIQAVLFVTLVGCAKASNAPEYLDSGFIASADASCGDHCDHDGDGVVDGMDQCPNTPPGSVVNKVGCADSQLTPMLVPFPPFGLTWTSGGDLGRAGGLTWTYLNIQRRDLFHIDWIVCDDPATPCGLSLDGPIDAPAENWKFAAATSDLLNGKLVFTNTTHIALADASMPQLNGRLTVTITDGSSVAVPCADVATMHVTPRSGGYGAEIPGIAFTVVALGEVQDPTTMIWTPYLDYYDAAPTPTTGGGVTTSFGASFYAK
ncbi:MAG: hypothetical protein JWO36_3145 [Myxococcales bacterium]|nr:hypothetical protein [Myxococcales bacterium]